MTHWQPTFLAAAVVILCGTVVGVLAGRPSGDGATTVTQVVTTPGEAGQSSTGPSQTAAGTAAVAVTPPVGSGAPDTLNELNDRDQVDARGLARFGTVTIAKKSYEGVSTETNREAVANGSPPNRLVINTKGRYRGIKGLVGINDEAQCNQNGANVWITDGNGKRLWGPNPVSLGFPRRFDFAIENRARITFEWRTVSPAANPCAGAAYPAWGDVKFVK